MSILNFLFGEGTSKSERKDVRFVSGGLQYDSKESEYLGSFETGSDGYDPSSTVYVYRTKGGRFFTQWPHFVSTKTEDDLKRCLEYYNPALYVKIFGQPDPA